ncbi:MAG: hypothetical protein KF864_14130 [Phycisphaeraceae bacterium]|nr:hypothetical protein [Phycisphaeraceae bacterium]
MAAEPGGIASKLGTIYERRYAVELLLRVIGGRLTRLRWEPASGDEGGADIEVEHVGGAIEHIQLKRQKGSDAEWSVAALDREGVLSAAARVTTASSTDRFTFVSSDPVPHIKDICDQLMRSSDPPAEFITLRVNAQNERRACFDELLRRWGLAVGNAGDEATAIARLRAMRCVQLDRGEEGAERLLNAVQFTLTGTPEDVVAILCLFLEGHLGKDVSAQELLDHLTTRGLRPRDLARDPSLPSALLELREEFRSSLRDRLVAGTWMSRPEVGKILEHIAGVDAPRVILVHGKPGVGKSGVLLGVADGIVERGIPLLPLSLSTRPPEGSVHQYGEALGLHATPSAALRASAGQGRTVLLVDQLDALRLTTSGAAATWRTCAQMLRAAMHDPDMVLVVACRTFDLENDANIRQWKESIEKTSPGSVVSIDVSDLKPADIEPILRAVGVEYGSLPPRLQKLLVHPNTLDAWHRLAARGSTRRDFATQTQLLAALFDALRAEAVRTHLVPDGDVHQVLVTARETMERTGRLAAPASVFDGHSAALRACCAVGLLVRSGGTVSFPHQSYFDHLVAKTALTASGYSPQDIVRWIKLDQSLERRDQLRQLLFTLRDEDPTTATQVAGAVLRDPDVRFHLKQLVCGVLREAEPITSDDVALVAALAIDDHWADHVIGRIIWRSPSWFDAFQSHGVWERLLRESTGERRGQWLRTILMVMEQRPAEVDQLLKPVLAEADGTELVGRALWHDPSEDSPAVAALRDGQIRAGRWGVQDFMLDKVAQSDPERAVRLVESAVRGHLRRRLTVIRSGSDERIEGLREGAYEKEVARAVTAQAAKSYPAFSRLLRLAERLKGCAQPKAASLDDLDTRYFRVSSFFSGITEILITLTAHAVAGLAEAGPGKLQRVLDSKHLPTSSSLTIAVASGLARASDIASDAALAWLVANPERLSLRESYQRDEYGLAADVIRRHTRTCSESALRLFESYLLKLYPESEKEHYRYMLEHHLSKGHWGFTEGGRYHAHVNPIGRAQHVLLGAIPQDRRSPAVRDRLREWDAKFGGPAVERPGVQSRGGWVGSPIPQDRINRLTDRQWLDIVSRRWTSRKWKQLGPERVAESSPEHFANDLGQAAKAAPRRFVQLALRFPPEAPAVYFSRLCDALADRATDIATCDPTELDALLIRTTATEDRSAITSACRAIENHPHIRWGEAAWKLLEIAAAHEEPKMDEFTVHSIDGETKRPDIESTSLNCVRGSAASALAALAWNDSERTARVAPIARQLAADPHPAVRIAAAHTAFGVYTVNKDDGVTLLTMIAGHEDDRVLSGHWVSHLVQYARWSHPSTLHPVFDRMMRSALPKVAEQGARWVTAEYLQCGTCADKYAECRKGTVPQRVGVATTLGHLLCDERAEAARVEAELRLLFDDSAPEVRAAAAGVFRVEGVLHSDVGGRLAGSFVRSAAFVEHSEDLLWSLSHDAVNLVPFSSSVFAAADRFANELADQTRSMQNRLGMAGRELSSLLLRLYDAATKLGDRSLAKDGLDRWDALLASRVGDADAHLESLIG